MEEYELRKLRKRIDVIDWKLVQLLKERMEIALKTRKHKESIFDAQREELVLENVKKYSHSLLRKEFSEKLMKEILKESKELQRRNLRLIGFQGEHGAFSELAALNYNLTLIPIPCREFRDVFDEVKNSTLDFGIVPVENFLEGQVTSVSDLLIETELVIVGEIVIPVHHCLLALPETSHREIKIVYSHPQALAQCREFIMRHKFEPRPFYDTAGAAKMLSEERPEGAAVIANELGAELYQLEIIEENIEDHPVNATRFVVLAKKGVTGGDKCSIVFSVKHEASALFNVLKIFSAEGINLTRIESRPEKGNPGRYIFMLDFSGSIENENVKKVLEKVRQKTLRYKFLGCYKAFKQPASY